MITLYGTFYERITSKGGNKEMFIKLLHKLKFSVEFVSYFSKTAYIFAFINNYNVILD